MLFLSKEIGEKYHKLCYQIVQLSYPNYFPLFTNRIGCNIVCARGAANNLMCDNRCQAFYFPTDIRT